MTTDNAYDMTYDMTLRQNTIASITLEQGTTKRTVQRWIAKCGEIGELRDNTRYFSDKEKTLILSHQAKRNNEPEVVEVEIVEPGAIELHRSESSIAAPLMAFNLEDVRIELPTLDVSALDAQTAQLGQSAQQGANAIAAALTARFDMGLAQIVAKQNNLLAGIEAQALNGAARSISSQQARPGKPC